MTSRKHADLWKKLADEAGEDEIDRAASVSVEQAEAELKAAGFDVAAERAKADAFLDALENGTLDTSPAPRSTSERAPASRVEPPRAAAESRSAVTEPPRARLHSSPSRPVRRPSFAWLAAAASVGAVAGGSLMAALERPDVATAPPHKPSQTDVASAAELRRQAAVACDTKEWSACLADLEKARAVDPDGDGAPEVKSLREQAIAGILK
jgi:hypothetical protein